MAEISVYGENANSDRMTLVDNLAAGEVKQDLPQAVDISNDLAREQAQWRATILTAVILVAVLGVEQVVPLSDTLRSQIGVLTVLLGFGFWNLLCGMIRPSVKKR
jgi:hypothetical protein